MEVDVVFAFDPPDVQAEERRRAILELERALARKEFEVWLQPQANSIGEVCGYEALLRWNHPERERDRPPTAFRSRRRAA